MSTTSIAEAVAVLIYINKLTQTTRECFDLCAASGMWMSKETPVF